MDFYKFQKDKNDAILWARGVLERKQNFVILDTETTGLMKSLKDEPNY
jgi:DNA polymerase III epsilon subunit-like protein